MPKRPKTILINAMHATTGGGLTYLRGIVPELARDARFKLLLLAPASALQGWDLPANVEVKVAPALSFAKGHMWEQLVLPFLALRWGTRVMLCNANYTPLLAWCSLPVIHTTPRAAGQAQGSRMKLYWKVLTVLTRVSLWNAPLAFSVAGHVVRDYVGEKIARKVRVAPPAVNGDAKAAAERDPNLVVTVGDFYAQKDYVGLVRAFRLLRDRRPGTRLMIIGRPVDAKVRDEVLALVRELKLADAVTLTGGMPHDKLMEVLGRASVYVSTSRAECFNIPVLEAMACGVPCVLVDADYQREVAGDIAVYVKTDRGGDVDAAFAVGMYGVLENSVLAEGLRGAGLKRAAGYTWAATAKIIGDGLAAA
ncbi:MAG: glycosyltransferase [Alphaproteobacteria bacterium]|nr:MAG: glycosyltransferase [Alphaproteobacteria bacterium]